MSFEHAVTLSGERCNGCDRCMKRCPTEAIRVRNGKAVINYARCIGCGECVRVCPTHSREEYYDPFEKINDYKYRIALPTAALYGQFNNLTDANYVLTGLKKIGFDDVFEVAIGGEIMIDEMRKLLKNEYAAKPVISTACPAVKNLILMRYADLKEHLSPIMQPEAISARLAVERALRTTGLNRKDIGVFLISPCAAHMLEFENEHLFDGVFSVKEIYFPLLAAMNKLKPSEVEDLCQSSRRGSVCASNAGSTSAINTDNFLTASGVENIISVLGAIEHEKLNSLDYVELFACATGCTGGSMNIENCFLARARMRRLEKYLPKKMTYKLDRGSRHFRSEPFEINNVFSLDENRTEAMKKLIKVNDIVSKLPQLDCGACGAPNCRAFAEDVVNGIKMHCKYLKGGGVK